jgi:hypothetical protein
MESFRRPPSDVANLRAVTRWRPTKELIFPDQIELGRADLHVRLRGKTTMEIA